MSTTKLKIAIHDNGHRILSPSGWDGWSRCTGMMVGLNESRKVSTDSVASVEGTTAHTLLEVAILTWTSPEAVKLGAMVLMSEEFWDDQRKWIDKITENINNTDEVKKFAQECYEQIVSGGYTQEMRVEIKKCYDRIKAYKDDGWEVLAESKVSLAVYFGHKHCDGTSDVILYKGDKLIVADLKYGKGIEVNPEHSGQLSLYAGGAIASIWHTKGLSFEAIELVIMQPRIGNGVWKSWDWHYSGSTGLYAWLVEAGKKSEAALNALSGGDVIFEPNEKSCMWCHRKTNCKARLDKALSETTKAFASADTKEDSLERDLSISNVALSDILDRIPFITSFLNDMTKEAEKRAQSGETIPHRKLVKGRSSRSWANDRDELIVLFRESGIDPEDFISTAVKSPAQMDKVQLTDDQKMVVKEAVKRSYGKEALVPDSDKREAIIKNSVQAFKQDQTESKKTK